MKPEPKANSIKSSSTHSSSFLWAESALSLPSQPGVYWFLGKKDEVLYVGKAKNLKNRLRSYLQKKGLSISKRQLVEQAQALKHQVLSSELEALLVEAELIRTHQPNYNVLLKDDKSPIYLFISKEKFPLIKVLRKREIIHQENKGEIIGPFQSAYKLKEVLKIARKIFTWCEAPPQIKQLSNYQLSTKPCFYYHIGQCPGACVGEIKSQDYKKNIKQLKLFLKGKKKDVEKNISEQIKKESDLENFELAAQLRDRLKMIEEVTSPGYRLRPDISLPQLKASQAQESLLQLSRILRQYFPLPANFVPQRIEGYDVSNTQGSNASVSMVVLTDGEVDKSNYRLFNIRTLDTPNDYHMMKEALIRRQRHGEWGKPDLIIIDGGKGQLRAALSVWKWPNTMIISLVKHPDRIIIPKVTDSGIRYFIQKLEEGHPALKLAQIARDEAHRFSKKQHSKRRLSSMFS